MTRLRTLFLLFLLFAFSQNAQIVRAMEKASAPSLIPGVYRGWINMAGRITYYEEPREDVIHSDFTLRIQETTGPMQINVASSGSFSIAFGAMPIITYLDWQQMQDIGSGGCLGQKSEASGMAFISAKSAPTLGAPGISFTAVTKFDMLSFSPSIEYFGKNCSKDITPQMMLDILDGGFQDMFLSPTVFEIYQSTPGKLSGTCYLPNFELDADHAFVCTWFVMHL